MANQRKIPTIIDVANLAGVSISTVSRVMNNPEKVKLETRQKVYQAIDALNFVPQADARARALHGKGRIGVITPFFYCAVLCTAVAGYRGYFIKRKFRSDHLHS